LHDVAICEFTALGAGSSKTAYISDKNDAKEPSSAIESIIESSKFEHGFLNASFFK